jgi:hypothetical protein
LFFLMDQGPGRLGDGGDSAATGRCGDDADAEPYIAGERSAQIGNKKTDLPVQTRQSP